MSLFDDARRAVTDALDWLASFFPSSDGGAVRGIDVVVPVHDAREDVQRCLASVLRHGTGDFRLVVVDDASTDPVLVARLDHLARTEPRVLLLRNEVNQGFVQSANRGMNADSTRDVLLLNSDTEVPSGFLDRLRRAARHTARTGIVSPFTNDGTILSLPRWMTANPLPEGLDVESFDALVAGTSPRTCPEIVTAHGFCMLIRRDVLDRVGVFDEAFGRGYGEENDLCERAKGAGFEVRACDDLFVWHRGSASFVGETDALKTANLAVLGERHPRYHDDIQLFIRANPLAELQENVRYQLERRVRRRAPALLMVLHADPFADPCCEPVGGTQLHVLDLVRALALPRTIVAWPAADGLCATEVADGDVAAAVAHFVRHPSDAVLPVADRFALADPARERAFGTLLDAFDVGAAHLHHLSGWPVRAWRQLEQRGIPFAFTVHDYLCTCPSFYRLDLGRGTACACVEGDADVQGCLTAFHAACGMAAPGDARARVAAQRAEFGALLEAAQVVITPSEAARAIVARAFAGRTLPLHVIPHALAVPVAERARSPRDGVLRVALLGAPSAPWKGADDVLAVMSATRDVAIEWHVFGDAAAHGFPEGAAAALGTTGNAQLHLHGRYVRDEIAVRLARVEADVTLALSPWPETFSYTLSESWAAGVPAVVRDLGAPADRVRLSGAGIVVADAQGAASALRRLAAHGDELRRLADAARAAARNEPSLADNADRHRTACAKLLERVTPRGADPRWTERDLALFRAHLAARGHAAR